MLKNNRINIDLGNDQIITQARRARNRAEIRRNWRWLRGANCAACSNKCGPGMGVCFQLLFTNRVLQLENMGGKSDMLFEVNVSEQERSVPIEVYNALLQAFAELKDRELSEEAEKPVQTPVKPKNEASKTSSDIASSEKVNNPPQKKQDISSVESDPFEGINAGYVKKPKQITIAEISDDEEDDDDDRPLPF